MSRFDRCFVARIVALVFFAASSGLNAGDAACPAGASLRSNIAYVDKKSRTFERFRQWVDNSMKAKDDSLSPSDAVLLASVDPNAKSARTYCEAAIAVVDARVGEDEAAIESGRAPSLAHDSYLEVGPKIADLSETFAHCSAWMTEDQRKRWSSLADQAVWNIWNYRSAHWGDMKLPWTGWSVANPANNYHYSFLEATMEWALASGNPHWLTELCTKLLPAVVAEFSRIPGGGSLEGTAYGTAQMRLFSLYQTWLDSTGVDLAAENRHAADAIAYWVHATVPTLDRFAPIGDQSRVSVPDLYDYQRRLVLEARNLTHDTAAKGMASWWLTNISIKEMTNGANFRYDLLPALDHDEKVKPPVALTYFASGAGNLFARSAWSRDAMWLAFVAGNYTESHAHQEQGAFTLFQGDWLAVTENIWTHSGIQQGTETNNVLRFVRHGTTVPQHAPSRALLTITADDPTHGAVAASADLSPVYARGSGVHTWKRDIVFADRRLKVTDAFLVDDGTHAIFQVNVPKKPVVGTDGIRSGSLLIHVVEPKDAQISIVEWPLKNSGDDKEFLSGWRVDIEGGPGNGGFVVEMSAK
jgi:hypothetical protein